MGFDPLTIGAAASIGGSLFGMLGGGNNQPAPPPPSYQPQFQGQADQGAIAGIGNLAGYNAYGQNYGQASGIAQNMVNNPYAGLYQQGANTTAGAGWGVGGGQIGAGMDLMNAGQGMLPYAQSILQTGFDPQNALRDRTQQQLTDSIRAGESARGIAMSPYGAGIENKGLSDFNIDWQNQQLQRQNTAAQGAGYLANSGGNAINLGQNVSTLGLQTLQNASALPYSTANTISGNQLGALQNFGQYGAGATNTAQQAIADYLQYLGVGNQSAGVANQAYANQITAQNNQFNQNQKLGANLGAGLSGLGRLSGGSSGPTSYMNIGGYSMPQF
jgi:hypothetical protein